MSEQKYKLGDVFTDDQYYADRARFCNENNYMIIEITKEGNQERKFQIVEPPKPTEAQLAELEILEIKEWFFNSTS